MSIPEAGLVFFGLKKTAAYEAADRGDFPTERCGKNRYVATARLCRQLGIPVTTVDLEQVV